MKRTLRLSLVVALMVIVAACGGDGSTPSADGSGSRGGDATPSTTTEDPVDESTTEAGPGEDEPADDDSVDLGEDSAEADEPAEAPVESFGDLDWWACWWAADALDAGGAAPSDGARVATIPNCADGPASVGADGALSGPDDPPVYRARGALGLPSVEFTFEGDTLLQTNGGSALDGGDRLAAGSVGVTVGWIGVVTDVESHDVKYLISGLSSDSEYPQLLVEGEGPNRFAGWGGGGVEARSADGTVVDGRLSGVLLHLAPGGSGSWIEVDGDDERTGQGATIGGDVAGVTVGNFHGRNFSTTDHQMVFAGLFEGEFGDAERAAFWAEVERLAAG